MLLSMLLLKLIGQTHQLDHFQLAKIARLCRADSYFY